MLLITGANGQLGRCLQEVMGEQKALYTDAAQLDITDPAALEAFTKSHLLQGVVNCAAYTDVDKAEEEPERAYQVNALGPAHLARLCARLQIPLVHISTDYVFDGKNREMPYVETDAVDPQSAYGSTKLAGENFVKDFADRYFILRTAWLYGDGKNFARTMLRLSETHDKITVVNDQVGSPTSASELAKAIDALLFTENYGLFHATCEGSCCWADFARQVLQLAGKKTQIVDVTTEEYGAPAPRPAYSILENRMFKLTTDFMFADWHDAIAEYMKKELG